VSTPPREPNPLERAVASQVARAVMQHLPDGGERLVIRLTPPELGTVRVELTSRDGAVTARLMAEDDGVRQALDRALPQLRNDLRGDHPRLEIVVDRGDSRWGWSGQQHQHQQHGPSDRDDGRGARRRREGDAVFSLEAASEPQPQPAAARPAPVLGGRVSRSAVDALA
jgi:flagellar hook-length control protein FliK